METVFNYKLNDLEEMQKDSKKIIMDFHKVDTGGNISAYE